MNQAKLKRLLREYFNDTITVADCTELLNYLSKTDSNELYGHISDEMLETDQGPEFKPSQSYNLWQRIASDPRYTKLAINTIHIPSHTLKFYKKAWFKVAAALLVFVAAGLIFIKFHTASPGAAKNYATNSRKVIIKPGTIKATLTTEEGHVIILEEKAAGLIAKSGNVKVFKQQGGSIAYGAELGKNVSGDRSIHYNTLSTPKGGEYQVVLADGTKVWLNAASSLTYPTTFNGTERRVKLTGEAYFEVAKNAHQPFYVNTANGQVRVLGTHFNISSYPDDDATISTLLEGSIQISKNKSLSLLLPGQQATIKYNSDYIGISKANVEEVMAWKNGYFIFDEDNIAGIMKKVARWYDVDVQYQDPNDDQKFGGTFHRSKSITELLHYLEKIGNIHFLITGRRITVTK